MWSHVPMLFRLSTQFHYPLKISATHSHPNHKRLPTESCPRLSHWVHTISLYAYWLEWLDSNRMVKGDLRVFRPVAFNYCTSSSYTSLDVYPTLTASLDNNSSIGRRQTGEFISRIKLMVDLGLLWPGGGGVEYYYVKQGRTYAGTYVRRQIATTRS